MKVSIIRPLIIYGFFLLIIGLVGYLNNPEKAKTALISGGTFGGLFMLYGLISAKKVKLAWNLAFSTLALVFVVFTWRATVSWLAVLGGNSDKIVAGSLISSMWVASLLLGITLIQKRKALFT